jgi:hypothetical protein
MGAATGTSDARRPGRPTGPARYVVEALAIVTMPDESVGRDEDLAHRLRVGVEELLARLGVTDRGDGVQVRLVRQHPRRVTFASPAGSLQE